VSTDPKASTALARLTLSLDRLRFEVSPRVIVLRWRADRGVEAMQHQTRGRPDDNVHALGDALGGFVLTWPRSYKSLKVLGRICFSVRRRGYGE
jgi:hypothetical protein